jgi:threonine aldolase
MDIQRSLVSHAPLRRRPSVVLRRMLDKVSSESLPEDLVGELERRVAELLGKPTALFFPTGTMTQQVALRVHAERTGRRAFVAHPTNHLELWELHGYSAVHGLRYLPVGDPEELLRLNQLTTAVIEPPAALLIELPQREIGGLLPSWDELVAQVGWARERGAAAHLDGARLWESQPFYDRPHAEIAGLFDTVYVSIYKGLEGVSGGVLAGAAEVIDAARVWRRRLGGELPGPWPLALAGLIGLDERPARMAAYRDHAVAVAEAIVADGVADVRPLPPQTPMFHVHLPVSADDADRANRAMIDERGIQVIFRAQPQSLPSRCKFEFTVGENAMEFPPDEVAALVRELVERARS